MGKKKMLAIGAFGAVTIGIIIGKNMMTVPAYNAARVIDGDTFETTERQLIRLNFVDAPELDKCGGKEAKEELEKLIMNKPVYIKVVYRDKYMRLDGLVYTKDGFVNLKMVESGKARYIGNNKTGKESYEIKIASEKNASDKKGIFGEPCTQEVNKINAKCNIKGNKRGNDMYYHLPECKQYANTQIQLYMGDKWFCSEAEAVKAGFVKAGGCQD